MRNYREEWAEGEIEASALLDAIDELRADRATLQQMAYCLKDRLEAAESARRDDYQNWMTALDRNAELLAKLEAAEKERDALRAKIKAREQQAPVAWLHETRRDSDVVTNAVKHAWGKAVVGVRRAYSIPLYLAPGAQPAPSVPDGWKLVPIEPTPKMIDAAEYVDWGDADVRGSCINAWNRMLSVAPEVKL